MSFSVSKFEVLRPFLYHHTRAENLHGLRATRTLFACNALLGASSTATGREKRTVPQQIQAPHGSCWLQTQRPLHQGNIRFEEGWTFEQFLHHLNDYVFFWPGKPERPSDYGQRHLEGNDWQGHAVTLRVPTRELFRRAPQPLFCPYNSGSPRCVNGRRSPRGPSTFLEAKDFSGTLSDVVEVVCRHTCQLPAGTMFRSNNGTEWQPL